MNKHWNLSPEQEVAAARLTRDAVEMLTAAAERGGIEIGERGPRFVQRLIDAEFPLKTIGDYVGHRSPESTEIYTKVAIAALREVAMGNGEEL